MKPYSTLQRFCAETIVERKKSKEELGSREKWTVKLRMSRMVCDSFDSDAQH